MTDEMLNSKLDKMTKSPILMILVIMLLVAVSSVVTFNISILHMRTEAHERRFIAIWAAIRVNRKSIAATR